MKRILVATDFSTRSDRALRATRTARRRAEASLILVHVVDGDRSERLVASERREALSLLAEAADTLSSSDGIEAEPMVVVDDVHSGILDAADRSGAGLIVLGPHRRRARDVFIGTIVDRVVRRSRLPLLVAEQPPVSPYERTLLALDFDAASKSAGHAAVKMGIFADTDVVVMHAFDTPAEGMSRRSLQARDAIEEYVATERARAVERLDELVRELGLPPGGRRVAAINGTEARTILESATSEDAQLIVLGTNQRKGFERLLIGSVTESLIRDAHRDVLIIPVDEAA